MPHTPQESPRVAPRILLAEDDVAQKVDGRCPVVFVTAYGDHALQAFDAGAVDDLLKPVEAARLVQTVVARLNQRLRGCADELTVSRPFQGLFKGLFKGQFMEQ